MERLSQREPFPPRWGDLDELGELAEVWTRRLREARMEEASGLWRVAAELDRVLLTDQPEHLDDPEVSQERKLRIVSALHRQNELFSVYRQFRRLLAPHLQAAQRSRGGPVRVLEIAAGSGDFSLYLAADSVRRGIPIEVVGSDVVQSCVDDANARAAGRGLPVRFERIDASRMSDVADGAYDVVFVAQSIHHFSPRLLAQIMAESFRVARIAFVAADGRRSLAVGGFIISFALLSSGPSDFTHDAMVSARKLYCEAELELLARLAAPAGGVRVGPRLAHSVVEITRA